MTPPTSHSPKNSPLKIGCVPYLNSKPLIHHLPYPILLQPPAQLAHSLHSGTVNIALVPIVECFRHPIYTILDGIGIISKGAVHSVILILNKNKTLPEITSISLHSHSLTSIHLLQALLHLTPETREKPISLLPENQPADATLWIGDPAIEKRKNTPSEHIIDLGTWWNQQTKLPFTYAVWALRPEITSHTTELHHFHKTSLKGTSSIDQIATDPHQHHYLTENIHFHLNPPAKQGIEHFHQTLTQIKKLPKNSPPLHYLSPH